MTHWQRYGLLLGALVLPGLLIYLGITRMLNPPVTYVVKESPARPVATAPKIVHRGSTPALAESPALPVPQPAAPAAGGTRPQRPSAPVAGTSASTTGTRPRPVPEHQATPSPSERRPAGEMPPAFALMRLFQGIGRLAEDTTAPLTPAQAKAILAIVTPLRARPTLTPEQATRTRQQLEAVLTAAQRAAITQRPARGTRPDGPPPGAGDARGPGGSPPEGAGPPDGPTGDRQPGDRPSGPPPGGMANMNPFNTTNQSPMSERVAAVFTALEARARQ